MRIDHSTLRYQSKRADDTALRTRPREPAQERRRFGYRRLGWPLTREGHSINHKKPDGLCREERLMVRGRGGGKRALGTCAPMPVQNAYIESFNSKLRDECLNERVFVNLAEAREIIEAWRHDYNCFRPHSSLGALTPREFADQQRSGRLSKFGLRGRPLSPPPQQGQNINRLYL